ncbi:MAG: hypothetical protein ACR2PL_24020, partial [Dehalococcoidia bacterium]
MTMRIFRVGVLILALGLVSTGLWALGAPNSWYATFPGLGHAWVAALGPYNEHLARDVGAALLGFGVLLAWTAAAPRAPLAPA